MSEPLTTYTEVLQPGEWVCKNCGQKRIDHLPETPCTFERQEYEYVAMLRIRNEERWIERVIDSVLPLCSRVFILDDHSEDGTGEIYNKYSEVTAWMSPFTGMDEARDKNWLYDQIVKVCRPGWILCVDGDEVLEKKGPDIIREHCSRPDARISYKLQIIFMWNNEQTARTDRIYGDFWRPSLFRAFHPDPENKDHLKLLTEFRFMSTPFGRTVGNDKPNLHCSSVPQRLLHRAGNLPVRLKHFGYMDREDRIRKLDFYTAIDWRNKAEDYYRHMVQGDKVQPNELPKSQALLANGVISQRDMDYMTLVTPDMRLVHAGPIELGPFQE